MPHDGRTGKTTDVWITPKEIIGALGTFDCDPCAATVRPWDCAARNITIEENGLLAEWNGRVWLNPPYSKAILPCKAKCRKQHEHITNAIPGIDSWMKRMAVHGNGIALVTPRTDTEWWHQWVLPHARARMELRGRVRFCRPDGKPGPAPVSPSVLLAYSWADVEYLFRARRHCVIDGEVILHVSRYVEE